MCRIFMARSAETFAVSKYLPEFAEMCRNSSEYQGHGWGMALRRNQQWSLHKSLGPIWDDNIEGYGDCDFLMIHARSAFRNEGIVLENNMPFFDGRHYFIFNGELQGVRIREEGRIGAEKIFNYIKRFDKGDMQSAFQKALQLIPRQTRFVRGLNILMTDGEKIYANCHYGEDPDYFTLWSYSGPDDSTRIFCSQPLDSDWTPMENRSVLVV